MDHETDIYILVRPDDDPDKIEQHVRIQAELSLPASQGFDHDTLTLRHASHDILVLRSPGLVRRFRASCQRIE